MARRHEARAGLIALLAVFRAFVARLGLGCMSAEQYEAAQRAIADAEEALRTTRPGGRASAARRCRAARAAEETTQETRARVAAEAAMAQAQYGKGDRGE